MAAASTNEELCRISKGLYTIINGVIGQESAVRTRRQLYDLLFILFSYDTEIACFISGSRAEGFHFESSDIDAMFIYRTVLVIDSELRMVSNNVCFPITFLMENDNAPPGFTLLKCIRYDSRVDNPYIDKLSVIRGDSKYMSSKGAQEITLMNGMTTKHGPCRRGTIYGIEYDFAYTLKCPFWPKQAHSFIHRSIHNGWPTTDEIRDICKDGCLLVPIDSKQSYSSDHADLEWRISFSLAEKKLVHSMNHCQFLCYGLMKIFLNEVLIEIPETKTETGNVLCSYFMKTAVFWEISENVNDWSTRDFLNRFLNVFRRVIRWVEDGYCPNFFIPEHNMFYGKIYGRRQRELMFRLRSLYDEGIMCRSHFEPLGNILSILLNNRLHFSSIKMRIAGDLAFSKEESVIHMLTMLRGTTPATHDISAMKNQLCFTASLIPDSTETLSGIKLRINTLLQMLAMILAKPSFQNLTSNKLQYLFTKRARSILKKTKSAYCLSTIHQAVISYMNGEYHKTIQFVDHIQHRVQTQPYMYDGDIDRDKVMESRQQGMSYEEIVKRFIICNYEYDCVISIPELTLESIFSEQNSPSGLISIPPLVFLLFLVVLSYTRLNKPVERKKVLGDLHSMLYSDNNHHINIRLKAISWEILGICQQLCGDYVGAYQSFVNALNDTYNEFKEAMIIRILILLFDLYKLQRLKVNAVSVNFSLCDFLHSIEKFSVQ